MIFFTALSYLPCSFAYISRFHNIALVRHWILLEMEERRQSVVKLPTSPLQISVLSIHNNLHAMTL